MNRKQEAQEWKDRHIAALVAIGFTGSFRALKTLENRAHRQAENLCNGYITQEEDEALDDKTRASVARLFGGTLPVGFKINGDPRGYALKIDPEKGATLPRGLRTDWGGYGILAPDF